MVCGNAINGVFLDSADVDRGINERPSAAVFAGVFAHECTSRWEGVVVADDLYGARVIASAYQCNVGGNVNVGRAHCFTRDALPYARHTCAGFDVGKVFLLECCGAFDEQLCSLDADGTIGRGINGFCQRLCRSKVFGAGIVGSDAFYKAKQLRQAIAARNTLAARL